MKNVLRISQDCDPRGRGAQTMLQHGEDTAQELTHPRDDMVTDMIRSGDTNTTERQ